MSFMLKLLSLMYAQVCTRHNIAFAINISGRYLSDPDLGSCKVIKKVMSYLHGTRDYMSTYKKSGQL